MSKKDRNRAIGDLLMNNAMFIIIGIAVIFIAIQEPAFIKPASIVNIINLTMAKLPIALGVGGCIILAGTDISAGRQVGLAAAIAAGLQLTTNKLFPGLQVMPIPVALLAVLVVGAIIGLVNGFCMAHFKLHPFIVTLSTQLIVYGMLLMFMQLGTNSGQTLSGMSQEYRDFVTGTLFKVGKTAVPNYVLYSAIIAVVVWVIWNKTAFGKNMYAVGSNEEAANVSGVNVEKTIIMVFMMAGMLYAITGFFVGTDSVHILAKGGLIPDHPDNDGDDGGVQDVVGNSGIAHPEQGALDQILISLAHSGQGLARVGAQLQEQQDAAIDDQLSGQGDDEGMELKLSHAEAIDKTDNGANCHNSQQSHIPGHNSKAGEQLVGGQLQTCGDTGSQTHLAASGNIGTGQDDTATDTQSDGQLCCGQRNDIDDRG
ncbi:MAG: hypothetical protein IJD98_05655, partial [Oscillospiraceae bacterium]|nr:hypothetical protein [Oscillospiraceae bacterium]